MASIDTIPLVIVQGFLGTAGIVSWDRHINTFGQDSLARRKILLPNLGPVSSLHDRACELYYSLAGGRVDYGAEHSSVHQHARYGRTFPIGLYPTWSKKQPLHFVGHSIGGPTVVKMQHLLQEAPDVRPFSLGSLLTKLIHVAAYLSPLLPSVFDQLWKSDWAASTDAVPYDMTFEAADHREEYLEGRPHPNTFYRSHVSRMRPVPHHWHEPPLRIASITRILLYFWATTCSHQHSIHEPSLENLLRNPDCLEAQLISGCWVVRTLDDTNHLSLIPGVWGENPYQRNFWVKLGRWLDAVDELILRVKLC
ncbi:alpha beta-hydrolase [Pholiota molesta]|nr:alpha beta-hydrolase [Pholiota molesta]